MSRAQFEKLTTEGLLAWLVLNEVVLDADEQALFRKNKIDGDSLLGMTSLFCLFLLLDLSRSLQIKLRVSFHSSFSLLLLFLTLTLFSFLLLFHVPSSQSHSHSPS